MRRIVIISLTTIVAVGLLFSYDTSTNTMAAPGPAAKRQSSSGGIDTRTPAGAAPLPAPAARRPAGSAGAAATFTGDAADTRWGPVQVRITVQGGRITTSEAVQHPQESRRDVQINDYALPILSERAVQAQSASIDTVSGATVTSGGYIQSLQSAIDQANL